jgi:hypothetical protein
MKIKIIITALTCCIGLFASCGGGRNPQSGKDTVNNRYGVSKDTSKIDTGKVTSPDNTASGGTNIAKDTSKQAAGKK